MAIIVRHHDVVLQLILPEGTSDLAFAGLALMFFNCGIQAKLSGGVGSSSISISPRF